MAGEPVATVEGPPRRRDSWSLKTIVEDVAGRPITEFQDPDRPLHPYLRVKLGPPEGSAGSSSMAGRPIANDAAAPTPYEEDADPVHRVYPPLTGATGRALHGPSHEHHAETLRSVPPNTETPSPGSRPHTPGPSRKPERVYLHYLLLHLDRLNHSSLRYLKQAVDEEIAHREPRVTPAGPPD